MKFHLINTSSEKISKEPINIGIPLKPGTAYNAEELVICYDNTIIPSQLTALTFWPNKSIKWVQCDFLIDLEKYQECRLVVRRCRKEDKSSISGFHYKLLNDSIVINTGSSLFEFNTSTWSPLKKIEIHDKSIISQEGCHTLLKEDNGTAKLQPIIDKFNIESTGPIRFTISASGHFDTNKNLSFSARIHFFCNTAKTCQEFSLCNPNAARHPGGLWDLGDPSSFLFHEFSFLLPLITPNRPNNKFQITPDNQWEDISNDEDLKIYQESSGGKQWNSPNHRNREGIVPMARRGYFVKKAGKIIDSGDRAQPILLFESPVSTISVHIPKFWQEFPKSLEINNRHITVGIYPECFPDVHELQGGEQKTHFIYIDFDTSNNTSAWGTHPVHHYLDTESIKKLHLFREITWGAPAAPEYSEYLNAALESKSNFFVKREKIDEYGWRNFGELYADHEAVFHKGNKPFVSHYNNQYDALASFYREFLLTGDQRWAELAKDLARHIMDIDINHTDLDREEYCHGLFWHTDHYLDAGLSTHRMSSKEHLQQKNPSFCGGGPGAEHCYTTGLTYHYLLTGDPLARETVLKLADWCYLSLKGPQTVLAAILRGIQTLKRVKTAKSEHEIFYKFPFTRGTGNCLNAQLDAFELTDNNKYIEIATALIRGTIHPLDNIGDRDLLNAEISWSYTVFLVAICKFMEFKLFLDQKDADYFFARDALLHYARWMVHHEKPYLDSPESLEFPNETWAAQDLRKAIVIYYASKYTSGQEKETFESKSNFFLKNSFKELAKRDSRFFTRPLVLILQNGRLCNFDNITKNNVDQTSNTYSNLWEQTEHQFQLNWKNICQRIITDIFTCLTKTSIRREFAWLRARIVDSK